MTADILSLGEKCPELLCILKRRAKEVSAPRAQAQIIDRINLRAAKKLLNGLSDKGVRELVVAGNTALLEALIKADLLSEFHVPFIVDQSGRDFVFGSEAEMIPVKLPESCFDLNADAVLVLDSASVPRNWPENKLVSFETIPPNGLPFDVPEALFEEYNLFTDSFKAQTLASLDALGSANKVILFAGIYTYFNFNRLSIALRKKGFRTAFLCLNPGNQTFKDKDFDLTLHAHGDLALFYWVLSSFPFSAVHYQGWLNLHSFAAAAAYSAEGNFVIEFNDMAKMLFAPEEYDTLFGAGLYQEEEKAVEALISRSRSILFNYAEGFEEDALAESVSRQRYQHFHSYPLPEFFASSTERKEGPFRICFAGTLNPSFYPEPPFGDVKLMDLAQLLTNQGIEFHVYLNPYQSNAERGVFWDYQYLAASDPRFFLHPGCRPAELPKLIAPLDFGSMLYLFPEQFTVKSEHLAYIMPTKFFSYLEAGLPVLVSGRFTAVCNLVTEHGLGLVIEQDELVSLASILERCDLTFLKQNVIAFRDKYNLNSMIGRLESFYSGVSE